MTSLYVPSSAVKSAARSQSGSNRPDCDGTGHLPPIKMVERTTVVSERKPNFDGSDPNRCNFRQAPAKSSPTELSLLHTQYKPRVAVLPSCSAEPLAVCCAIRSCHLQCDCNRHFTVSRRFTRRLHVWRSSRPGLETFSLTTDSSGTRDPFYTDTQAELLKGEALATVVIRKLRLDREPIFVGKHISKQPTTILVASRADPCGEHRAKIFSRAPYHFFRS